MRKRRNCFSVVFKYVVKRIEWIRGRKGNIIMGTANQIEQELMNYISDHKIRNTHSHHLPEQAMVDFDLDKLINNTYLQWQQVTPGTTAESRNAYLEKTRYKSYFVWLQKAIAREFAEIREFVRKAAGNIPPLLLDKETLCRKLNIAERTLYRDSFNAYFKLNVFRGFQLHLY